MFPSLSYHIARPFEALTPANRGRYQIFNGYPTRTVFEIFSSPSYNSLTSLRRNAMLKLVDQVKSFRRTLTEFRSISIPSFKTCPRLSSTFEKPLVSGKGLFRRSCVVFRWKTSTDPYNRVPNSP